ncbi:MAG TPA: GNAT family N-acetyltransferase [Gemmatimonadaceae bacterium]
MTITNDALHLRAARPADRATIADLTMRSYAQYARVRTPGAWAALEEALKRSLADDTGVTRIVAELDGRVVGSVALYDPGAAQYTGLDSAVAWPEVRLVAVDPAVRGRGVARALVLECVRRARAAGAPTLGLHTSQSMHTARRLYERLGFIRDPDHDFHPPGAELVEGYRLPLDDPAPHPES